MKIMEQMKILLVDDNRLALKYLKMLVDWESCGFTVVGTATDGRAGLRKYQELKPQVVITDIQMPVMSGIELSRKIREMDSTAKIIFLSSYDEFDYARSALNLKVSDYILKHELNETMLKKRLGELKKELEEEKKSEKIHLEHHLIQYFEDIKLQLPKECQWMEKKQWSSVLIAKDKILPPFQRLLGTEETVMGEQQIKEICCKASPAVTAVLTLEEDLYFVLLDEEKREGEMIQPFCYELKKQIQQETQESVSIFIMYTGEGVRRQRSYFWEKKEIVQKRYFLYPSVVIHSSIAGYQPEEEEIILKEEIIKKGLEQREEDPILEYLDTLFLKISKQENYELLVRTTEMTLKILEEYDGQIKKRKNGEVFELWQQGEEGNWYTAYDILKWAKAKFRKLIQFLLENEQTQYTRPIRNAMDYICSNYQRQELSLEEIAGAVGVGGNHLNTLFNKELGMTVHRYLSMIRIEKAKEFLRDDKVKLGDIPAKTGYANSQYFSKVFKRAEGVTPLEYRRSH